METAKDYGGNKPVRRKSEEWMAIVEGPVTKSYRKFATDKQNVKLVKKSEF